MPDLTYQDVLDILRIIDSGSFADVQIEYEGTKVKVTRQPGTMSAGAGARLPAAEPVARQAEPAKPPAAPPHGTGSTADVKSASAPGAMRQGSPDRIPNGVEVRPPMAGTYYCAPSPGAAPYVEVNRVVKKGDQLGIVEVMKLFTPVLAPCDGTVRAILVGNEEFVQSDQALMIIEPAK